MMYSRRRILTPSTAALVLLVLFHGHSAEVSRSCSPPAPPASGFGTGGSFTTVSERFYSPGSTGDSAWFFHPGGAAQARPVILFCHGLGAVDPAAYMPLITNLVSQGCCVVYPPYLVNVSDPTVGETYRVMLDGVDSAVSRYQDLIDTTRAAVVGHSFGAGAAPWLGGRLFGERGWGRSGAFMYLMAPWYSFLTSDEELAAFPRRVRLVMEIFSDDAVNDHRMAVDLFTHIGIPDSHKVFLTLVSDTCGRYRLTADHSVPTGPSDSGGVEDGLDFHGVYRIADALIASSFFNDRAGRRILFGSGRTALCAMGTWGNGRPVRPLIATRDPAATRPSSTFMTSWEFPINPRNKESITYQTEELKRRFEGLGRSMKDALMGEMKRLARPPSPAPDPAPAPQRTAPDFDTL